jgi:hypothetical protein
MNSAQFRVGEPDLTRTSPKVRVLPIATDLSLAPDVSFLGEAEVGRAAEFAASVENDRAARLAAIPVGASPANRGVQSLL